ncbi:MAG: glycine--tRNA ligase subunit beta, partial [Desulfobacterales bacterium]|nr:glycine--tRNA ligase subunit beta [Desulfobacterales bacterium]
MSQLLVEIGTEEIPAGYIEPALNAFADSLFQHLDQSRIAHGKARVFGTPRRLTVAIDDVADRQQPQTQELMGPPARIAFEKDGTPTVAAKKFAEKNDVSVGRLSVRETEKGRYVVARKTDAGQATRLILKKSLPSILLAIPFPKTMRWSNLSIEFARPIHSILVLLP